MKGVVLFCASMLLCVSAAAQGLVGVWKHVEKEKEGAMTVYMNLAPDGTMKYTINADIPVGDDEKEAAELLSVEVSFKGTWSVRDDTLTQTMFGNSLSAEIVNIPKSFPKLLVKLVMKSAVSELKKEMKKSFSEPVRSRIASLGPNELVIENVSGKQSVRTTFVRDDGASVHLAYYP